jgi:hypothetical protein
MKADVGKTPPTSRGREVNRHANFVTGSSVMTLLTTRGNEFNRRIEWNLKKNAVKFVRMFSRQQQIAS